jgi:cytochrome b
VKETIKFIHRIHVWDWPTRLVHWLLVALVFFSWGSAEYHHMDLHRYSGYTVLGLLVFRLYWGIFGSDTARFANFVKGPRAIANYLRSSTAHFVGHNPLGALSVVALLALLLTQVAFGLFAVDTDGLESGPLSYLVSFDAGRIAAKVHGGVFNVLLGLIVLHIVAILFYLIFKRNNLVAPMITGRKSLATDAPSVAMKPSLLRVAVGVVLAAAIVWTIV